MNKISNFLENKNAILETYELQNGQNLDKNQLKNQTLITNMFELLKRNHKRHLLNDSFNDLEICELIAKLVLIKKLSESNHLEHNNLHKGYFVDSSRWVNLIYALKNHKNELIKNLFINDTLNIKNLSAFLIEQIFGNFLHHLLNLNKEAEVTNFIRELLNFVMLKNAALGDVKISSSIADFVSNFLQTYEENSFNEIYVASNASFETSLLLANKFGKLLFQSSSNMSFYATLSLLNFKNFEVKGIKQQGQLELKKPFDLALSFSPMGFKIKNSLYESDYTKSIKYEIDIVYKLLEVTKKAVIVSLTDASLFSSTEKEFRKTLIKNGFLQALISLPSGIWSGTYVKSSLLILSPRGGNNKVRFVDLNQTDFYNKDSRQAHLTNTKSIVELVLSDKTTKGAISVDAKNIVKKDYDLLAQTYVLSEKKQNLEYFLQENQTIKLDSIGEFKRGLPHKNAQKNPNASNLEKKLIFEVGAAELDSLGYIANPTKEIFVNADLALKYADNFLQAQDIIIITKGSVGKVGLVADYFDDKKHSWILNQSGLILRLNKAKYNPKILYLYLQSEMGQEALASITKGSSIANIGLSELKKLEVPILSEKQTSEALEIIEEILKNQLQIDKLTKSQFYNISKIWRLVN